MDLIYDFLKEPGYCHIASTDDTFHRDVYAPVDVVKLTDNDLLITKDGFSLQLTLSQVGDINGSAPGGDIDAVIEQLNLAFSAFENAAIVTMNITDNGHLDFVDIPPANDLLVNLVSQTGTLAYKELVQQVLGGGPDQPINTVLILDADTAVIGGQQTLFNGNTSLNFSLFNKNTGAWIDCEAQHEIDDYIFKLISDGHGGILVAGQFIHYNTDIVNGFMRLREDFTIDEGFRIANGAGFLGSTGGASRQWCIALQSDGKILVGGQFKTIDGHISPFIARLNADGSKDTSFVSCSQQGVHAYGSGAVKAIAVQSDGKILAGSNADFWYGSSAGYSGLVRMNADGTRDTSFTAPAAITEVYTIAVQSDGKILVGGQFALAGAYGIARLNADGTRDTSFNVGTAATYNGYIIPVRKILLMSDGTMYVGGSFQDFNGTEFFGLVKLTATGAIDDTFTNHGFSQYGSINDIAFDGEKLICAGTFGAYDGLVLGGSLIAINPDGSFDRTVFVAGTTIHDTETGAEWEIVHVVSDSLHNGTLKLRVTDPSDDPTFNGNDHLVSSDDIHAVCNGYINPPLTGGIITAFDNAFPRFQNIRIKQQNDLDVEYQPGGNLKLLNNNVIIEGGAYNHIDFWSDGAGDFYQANATKENILQTVAANPVDITEYRYAAQFAAAAVSDLLTPGAKYFIQDLGDAGAVVTVSDNIRKIDPIGWATFMNADVTGIGNYEGVEGYTGTAPGAPRAKWNKNGEHCYINYHAVDRPGGIYAPGTIIYDEVSGGSVTVITDDGSMITGIRGEEDQVISGGDQMSTDNAGTESIFVEAFTAPTFQPTDLVSYRNKNYFINTPGPAFNALPPDQNPGAYTELPKAAGMGYILEVDDVKVFLTGDNMYVIARNDRRGNQWGKGRTPGGGPMPGWEMDDVVWGDDNFVNADLSFGTPRRYKSRLIYSVSDIANVVLINTLGFDPAWQLVDGSKPSFNRPAGYPAFTNDTMFFQPGVKSSGIYAQIDGDADFMILGVADGEFVMVDIEIYPQ